MVSERSYNDTAGINITIEDLHRANVTISRKQGNQWPHKKTDAPQIFFKKIEDLREMDRDMAFTYGFTLLGLSSKEKPCPMRDRDKPLALY